MLCRLRNNVKFPSPFDSIYIKLLEKSRFSQQLKTLAVFPCAYKAQLKSSTLKYKLGQQKLSMFTQRAVLFWNTSPVSKLFFLVSRGFFGKIFSHKQKFFFKSYSSRFLFEIKVTFHLDCSHLQRHFKKRQHHCRCFLLYHSWVAMTCY